MTTKTNPNKAKAGLQRASCTEPLTTGSHFSAQTLKACLSIHHLFCLGGQHTVGTLDNVARVSSITSRIHFRLRTLGLVVEKHPIGEQPARRQSS